MTPDDFAEDRDLPEWCGLAEELVYGVPGEVNDAVWVSLVVHGICVEEA